MPIQISGLAVEVVLIGIAVIIAQGGRPTKRALASVCWWRSACRSFKGEDRQKLAPHAAGSIQTALNELRKAGLVTWTYGQNATLVLTEAGEEKVRGVFLGSVKS